MRPLTLMTSARVQAAARPSYLAISSIVRRSLASSASRQDQGHFHRSDFTQHGWTALYESGPPQGPLRHTSNLGVPRITPRSLKDHLDQYVVGQDKAKRTLAVAVYNHYQRIRELERQAEEDMQRHARPSRRDTIPPFDPPPPPPLAIEKSNILLLGPSGVGKTLMAKTLARTLQVPFSMSDCTPFTQAGYIGEDADVCVHRLLAAADYDVAKAERGIICLDEIDKIATARVSHGKDVSGEGVQQALLKIIEGTTLQIQAKNDKPHSNTSSRPVPVDPSGINPASSTIGHHSSKPEIFNVRTDNILFICTGAFIGLHKTVLDRVSRGSIGFGATVRSDHDENTAHPTTLRATSDLFNSHSPNDQSHLFPPNPANTDQPPETEHNILDLVLPTDLHKYGLIPELVGRIPVSCALTSLDAAALVKVLTEPRNSLLRQYEQLFLLSGIELRFTSGALHHVASSASQMGTGARGLRSVMEGILSDAMFETPGSGIKFVAVTRDAARRLVPAFCFNRDAEARFSALVADEEEAWEAARAASQDVETEMERRARVNSHGGAATTFEEYRQKTTMAGAA